MKKSFEEASELDGYEDLKPEDQAKVIKAWQDGHVADEDIPDSARKPVDEDGAEKPKKAKKAPAKKKALESDGEPEERPRKKAVTAKVRCSPSNRFTLSLIAAYIYRKLRKKTRVSLRRMKKKKRRRKKSPRRRGLPGRKLNPKKKRSPKKKRHPRNVLRRRKRRLVSFSFTPMCSTNPFI